MMKYIIFVIFSAFFLLVNATEIPTSCVSALRRALSSSAEWTMKRQLADSKRVFVTTGVVDCIVGDRIDWKVLYPFSSSVSMTTNAMVFVDEDGERIKPLEKLPYYNEIRLRTDSFAKGDIKAFDGLFDVEVNSRSNGEWRLTFTPENRAMRRLFTSATLSGREELTSVLLKSEDGGFSEIRFKEIKRAR